MTIATRQPKTDAVRELVAHIVADRDHCNDGLAGLEDGDRRNGLEHERATLNILLTKAGELGLIPADLDVWVNGGF